MSAHCVRLNKGLKQEHTCILALETTKHSERFPTSTILKELIGYTDHPCPCDSLFVGCYKNESNLKVADPYAGEGFRLLVHWNDKR